MAISGLENVPIYIEIAVATFIFSVGTWFTLFAVLDMHDVKYTKKIKRSSLWLIFLSLIALISWGRFLHFLLSRLQ